MPDFLTPEFEVTDPELVALARERVLREPDAAFLLDVLGLDEATA